MLQLAHTVPVCPAWFLPEGVVHPPLPNYALGFTFLEHGQEIRLFAEAITNRAGIEFSRVEHL